MTVLSVFLDLGAVSLTRPRPHGVAVNLFPSAIADVSC